MPRPLIAIVTTPSESKRWPGEHDYSVYGFYPDAIYRNGGEPVIVPPTFSSLSRVNGMLFTGGNDWFFEELCKPNQAMQDKQAKRASGDVKTSRQVTVQCMMLAQQAIAAGLPYLGICAGNQLLALITCGRLTRVDPLHAAPNDQEDAYHMITLMPDAKLLPLAFPEEPQLIVNSSHSWGIAPDQVGNNLTVEATSVEDGSVESVSLKHRRFVLGVQFHPERLKPGGDAVFAAFLSSCGQDPLRA